MNWTLLLIYVAVGSTVKLLTLKDTSPGHRLAEASSVLLGAILVGWVTPAELTGLAAILVSTPFAGSLWGEWVGTSIDWVRIRLYLRGRQWVVKRSRMAVAPES